jgi:PST family polysaccharide transporter
MIEHKESDNSYKEIVKSTGIVGGAQVIKILIGIIRTKIVAVILGPGGIGIVGMYDSIISLSGTITNFGIGSSGARQIAESNSSNNPEKISKTILALRRLSLFTGLIGFVFVLALSKQISFLTFGNKNYTLEISIISIILLFNGISTGQLALLQGLRRLKELAFAQVWGSLFGAIASITIVYLFKEKGIPVYLVLIAAFSILTSWWYTRKINVVTYTLSRDSFFAEAKGLLSVGFAFMIAMVLGSATGYLTRLMLINELGINSVGIYTASWTLASFYVSIMLNAMGTDFFPRLTAVNKDNHALNKLVNEQTLAGMLFSIPGILFTITLSPIVLKIFYSSSFTEGADLIRWLIASLGFRIISWPLGYILLAKGLSKIFITTEIIFNSISIVLIYLFIKLFGLNGIGMAYVLNYIIYTIIMLFICHNVSSLKWSKSIFNILGLSLLFIAINILMLSLLNYIIYIIAGLIGSMICTVIYVKILQNLLGISLLNKLKSFITIKRSK